MYACKYRTHDQIFIGFKYKNKLSNYYNFLKISVKAVKARLCLTYYICIFLILLKLLR